MGYNRVFGYYIEVTKSFISQVPDHYIRKQTLTNCERYITPELKELEGEVLSATDRVVALEYQLFTEIRTAVAQQVERVQQTARALAQIDCLCSLAQVAKRTATSAPRWTIPISWISRTAVIRWWKRCSGTASLCPTTCSSTAAPTGSM